MAETRSEVQPDSDIYTVLTAIGALLLVVGTVYVSVRSQMLFGSWLPF